MIRKLIALAALLATALPVLAEFKSGGRELDGVQIAVDLPDSQHLRNRGGSDGSGLCVFASCTHTGRYQSDPVFSKLFEFMFTRPGGGYPEKLTRMIAGCASSLNLPVPDYMQHTGGDMEFLRLALKTGRYPCVTYDGRDGVFYRGPIAHMINLVYLDQTRACLHDNNYPSKYLWCSAAEFESRWKGNGGGWAVVLLNSPPSPIPINRPAPKIVRQESDSVNSLLLVAALALPAGQCENGRCAVPGRTAPLNYAAPIVRAAAPVVEWSAGDRPGEYLLYVGGVQAGGIRAEGGVTWHARRGPGDWLEAQQLTPAIVGTKTAARPDCSCKTCDCDTCLCAAAGASAATVAESPGSDPFPGGVVPEKIAPAPLYEFRGKPVTRHQAFELIEGGLIDDSKKCFLTWVGAAETGKRLRSDVAAHPAFAAIKERLHVNTYALDDWHVSQVGLAPGLTMQSSPGPDGKAVVLFRTPEYGTPEDTATAVRKADPLYDPSKDPDPKRPAPSPNPGPTPGTGSPFLEKYGWLLAVGAGFLILIAARKGQS